MNAATRSGKFTLVELLVVVAVVAILSALLLPALASSRELGKRAVCAGQMKQFGMATLSYCMDSDETLPGGLGNENFCTRTLRPYYGLKDDGLTQGAFSQLSKYLICPDEKNAWVALSAQPFIGQYPRNSSYMPTQYPGDSNGLYSKLTGGWIGNWLADGKKISKVKAGSAIALESALDGYGNLGHCGNIFNASWYTYPSISVNLHYPTSNSPFYHNAAENYLFVDGSVRCLSMKTAFQNGDWIPQ